MKSLITWKSVGLLFLLLVASAGAAHAQIVPVVTETGKISLSVDAIGTNASSGVVEVEKPAGATVRGAFFSCASFSGRVINDGDVTIDGTSITWDITVFNNAGASADFFHNTFADITSVVKPAIDAASAGRIGFTIVENNTTTIDGCILAVIFDDPGQSLEHTAVLLFGGQSTTGDTFFVTLADPIDTGNPALVLDLGLGISFGAQDQPLKFGGSHECGTNSAMFSLVDVNGDRLTSCAGNLDDAPTNEIVANGNLITVGGLDDTNDNPADPLQKAADGKLPRVLDDELYNLIPFVSDGDTTIVVDTLNPSDDDNIFFAHIFTLGQAAVGTSESVTQTFEPGLFVSQTYSYDNGNHTLTVNFVDGVLQTFDLTITAVATVPGSLALDPLVFPPGTNCFPYATTGDLCVVYRAEEPLPSPGSEFTGSFDILIKYFDPVPAPANPRMAHDFSGIPGDEFTEDMTNAFFPSLDPDTDPALRGRTINWSEFVAVDLAITDPATFIGFLEPLGAGGKVFKSGRTIPVKFQLTDSTGNPVTDAVAHISVAKTSNNTDGPVATDVEASGAANTDNLFRFDGDKYIYNLSTKGFTPGTYLLTVISTKFFPQTVTFVSR